MVMRMTIFENEYYQGNLLTVSEDRDQQYTKQVSSAVLMLSTVPEFQCVTIVQQVVLGGPM
jgi:hypothetical protein